MQDRNIRQADQVPRMFVPHNPPEDPVKKYLEYHKADFLKPIPAPPSPVLSYDVTPASIALNGPPTLTMKIAGSSQGAKDTKVKSIIVRFTAGSDEKNLLTAPSGKDNSSNPTDNIIEFSITCSKNASGDKCLVTINTSQVRGEKTGFNVVKDNLQRTIDSMKVTAGVKNTCLRPLPGDRINVVFRNEGEAQEAREHEQWLTRAMPNARVKGEPWYPIKRDMVSKRAVMDPKAEDGRALREEVCEEIKNDNSNDEVDCTAYKVR